MNRVLKMNQWGDFLGTRFLGEQARSKLNELLDQGPVHIDFEEVRGLSHSFADEFVGFVIISRGYEDFKKSVRFLNTNSNVQSALRFAIAERLHKGHRS